MNTLRYALAGYGKVAQIHAKALADVTDATLVAVWGRSEEKATAFAKQWDISFTDLTAMVTEAEVDVVIITTPHPPPRSHDHRLEAGAHVLVRSRWLSPSLSVIG